MSIQIKLENEGSDEELETDMLYSPQLALKLALTEWLSEFCVPRQYNGEINPIQRNPIQFLQTAWHVQTKKRNGFLWSHRVTRWGFTLSSQTVRCLRVLLKAQLLMSQPWLPLSALPQQSPLFSSSPLYLQPCHHSVWIKSRIPWLKDLRRKKRYGSFAF